MKQKLIVFFFSIFILSADSYCQEEFRIHAHNDYDHDIAFWSSYTAGAASIEADLVLRNDTLFVAHEEESIKNNEFLEKLYLQPLQDLVERNKLRPIQILLDIKSDAYEALEKVQSSIEKFPLLVDNEDITFVISGSRPKVNEYKNYPDYIMFDHQNIDDIDNLDLGKVALISKSFREYTTWNGYGRLTAKDLEKVDEVIKKVKAADKAIRFWATPDTKTAWTSLARMGVDYINTDSPALAVNHLKQLSKNTYEPELSTAVYTPTFFNKEAESPKNIILMIGDGNGLAQISASLISNGGRLSMTGLQDLGLVITSSADDLVTDSAAGATAMATGKKTNNRYIGVDSQGNSQRSIVEVLSSLGYLSGIITSDAIYGATPASFYAHTDERDDTRKILQDLRGSEVDLFISAGEVKENELSGFAIKTSLDKLDIIEGRQALFYGDSKMPSIKDGRGDFLVRSTLKTLDLFETSEKPFFLLIEGAQIDNGGHSNDIETIVKEMIDFDKVVGKVLEFADKSQNTLVIITADHETGGLGIAAGGQENGEVIADFLSVDHTGIMVPLFAYGPGSALFRGVFHNNLIYDKILEVLNIK